MSSIIFCLKTVIVIPPVWKWIRYSEYSPDQDTLSIYCKFFIWGVLREALSSTVGGLLITQCLFFFVFNENNSMLSVFMIEKFAVQPWQIAVLFAVGGMTMAIMQGGLVGPLVKRFGEKPLAIDSLLLLALATLGMVSVPALWMLYPIGVINCLGTGLIWPTLGALLANSVSYEEQGNVSGVGTALGSLMSIFGPLWAGTAYDRITPSAPFWIGAILFVLAGLLLTRVKVGAHAESSLPVHSMAD